MIYNQELLFKDAYYFSLIFDEILKIINSSRPHLSKNSLLTLSEVFEIKELNTDNKTDSIIRQLVTKIVEKNTYLAKDASECFNAYIKYNSFLNIIQSLIKQYGKNHSTDYSKLIIDSITKCLSFHNDKFISTVTFHSSMVFVANQFVKDKKIRPNVNDLIKELNYFYKGNQEKVEALLKKYFSEESLKFIIQMAYSDN